MLGKYFLVDLNSISSLKNGRSNSCSSTMSSGAPGNDSFASHGQSKDHTRSHSNSDRESYGSELSNSTTPGATENTYSQSRRRVTRRKHRNSRLGCSECKRRRIKCDETLPECRNCVGRQKKGGHGNKQCSYLSLNEDDIESFNIQKEQNRLSEMESMSRTNSERSLTEDEPSEIVMIAHDRVELPESVWTSVAGMESLRVPKVLYLQLLLNANQDWNLSSKAFVALAIYGTINSVSRKIKISRKRSRVSTAQSLLCERSALQTIAVRYKGELLSFVRQIISMFLTSESAASNEFIGTRLLISNAALQFIQMYNNLQYDDSHYIAMVDMCMEIYRKNRPENVVRAVQFYWSCMPLYLSLLYHPAYSTDLLYEILEVLKDFEPFISASGDDHLELHYGELVDYVEYLVGLLPLASGVMPLPIDTLYDIYRRWILNVPPEAFCITGSMSGVQRVFYTFYHSIPAYLNNLFPAGCYLLSRPFYGPTSFYPFTLNAIFENLENELGPMAEFSIRLLSFMERRRYMLYNFFSVEDPLRETISKNRFESRRVRNLKEKFIVSLRNELISWDNYPDIVPFYEDEQETANGEVFLAVAREHAIPQLEMWRGIKSTFNQDIEEPKDLSDVTLIDSILTGMKSDDPFASVGRKTPLPMVSVEYSNDKGYHLTDRGMFDNDCDLSLFFEQKPPAFLSVFPTMEEVQKYKTDRNILMRDLNNNLIF
ncbi:LANO_0D08218g1_1 [Lachancea nothofagi CBS 11611]|uniref:LANO_0D08218g1_1 n=1 Tax=Lachancea nothofagi CBS 11611 TaxID=1266666 RepID=A0A1G4JIK4_9SACH|nr:LANO_0D08218g1_1 [Lachancea nothofagi CBS 11611]